jgi:hypothetical protein
MISSGLYQVLKKKPSKEIIAPLKAPLDHLHATFFHHFIPMGKGYVIEK